MQKEVINGCELYLGDAMEILPHLAGVADCLVVDPPYLLTSGGGSSIMSGSFSKENYNNNGAIVTCNIHWKDFMKPMHDALKERAHAYIMTNNLHIEAMLREARIAGFDSHNFLVWYKKTKTQNRWYMKSCEFTGFFYKGKARNINDCSSEQLIELYHSDVSKKFTRNKKSHATEKPVALMEHYIRNSSQPGEIILDPFMGVGSTGVAAVQTGRRFIGIEIEQEWFDAACKRIEAAYHRPSLIKEKVRASDQFKINGLDPVESLCGTQQSRLVAGYEACVRDSGE